mmetsp:Transcript_17760/g.38578  ORF Transcript_17760/g.38578 Transcript_17760/m.38578 type:complete len:111 (-) Transcript_17760:858-1190(-)
MQLAHTAVRFAEYLVERGEKMASAFLARSMAMASCWLSVGALESARASEGPSLAKSFTASCDHTRPHNFSSGPAVGAACTVQPPVGTVSVQEGRLRHRRGRRRRTRLSRE